MPDGGRRVRARNRLADERGQAMTELALVLPVLVLILFGVIQFGILFNNYITLTDAARAGARKAAVSRWSDTRVADTEAQVRASAADLDQEELDVTTTSTWAPGSDVTVSATYPWSIELLGFVVQSGELRTETTERVE